MILPPVLSLILFGLAGLIAVTALIPQGALRRIGKRGLSLLITRFGEPVTNPPPQVLRAFHRGETLVVITLEEADSCSANPVLEIA